MVQTHKLMELTGAPSVGWRLANNEMVTLTMAQLASIMIAVGLAKKALYDRSFLLKDVTIYNMADQAALNAFDPRDDAHWA
jgi:hypothetical protein